MRRVFKVGEFKVEYENPPILDLLLNLINLYNVTFAFNVCPRRAPFRFPSHLWTDALALGLPWLLTHLISLSSHASRKPPFKYSQGLKRTLYTGKHDVYVSYIWPAFSSGSHHPAKCGSFMQEQCMYMWFLYKRIALWGYLVFVYCMRHLMT